MVYHWPTYQNNSRCQIRHFYNKTGSFIWNDESQNQWREQQHKEHRCIEFLYHKKSACRLWRVRRISRQVWSPHILQQQRRRLRQQRLGPPKTSPTTLEQNQKARYWFVYQSLGGTQSRPRWQNQIPSRKLKKETLLFFVQIQLFFQIFDRHNWFWIFWWW